MSDELPQGWATVRVSELCDVTKEKGREGAVPYLEIGNVEINSKSYTLTDKPSVKGCRLAKKSDVLVSKVRPTRGAIVWIHEDELQVSSAFTVLRNRGALVEKCLWHFLAWNRAYLNHLGENCSGTMYPTTSDDAVIDFEMPVAPLPEQRRIAAKLETLLGKVDACQRRLAKIPRLLKRFRQSVLAAACSGRLTADWRNEKDVDDEWPISPLSKLFTMRNGKSLTTAKRRDGDIPAYGGNGRMGTHNAANADGQVIVIGRVGAQCGNVHFVSGKVWVTDNAISLEAKGEVEPAFYAYFLRSQNLNQLSAGTGQPYVSQEILGPIETPVVSLPEQHEIVRRVERLFTFADQLEARFAKAQAQVDRLTPSLLAKAFRGELVPQDPGDEPASALLARIRSETNGAGPRTARARRGHG